MKYNVIYRLLYEIFLMIVNFITLYFFKLIYYLLLDPLGGPSGQIYPASDQSWTLSVGPSGPGLASANSWTLLVGLTALLYKTLYFIGVDTV